MALRLGIQTYEISTNDDEVCIPSLSSILLAAPLNLQYVKISPASLKEINEWDFSQTFS